MADGMGGSNRINSLIEAQNRARELGQPEPQPADAEEEETEHKAVLATWLIGGLAVVAASWWMFGPGVAAIVFACLAGATLLDRWIRSLVVR